MNKRNKVFDAAASLTTFIAVVLLVSGCGYIQPDKQFMKSILDIPEAPGVAMGGGTVEDFVASIKNTQMTNGKTVDVLGWKKEDNVYTLHMKWKDPMELRFVHVLSSPTNGTVSILQAASDAGVAVHPYQFWTTFGQNSPHRSSSSTSPGEAPKASPLPPQIQAQAAAPNAPIAGNSPSSGEPGQVAKQMPSDEKDGPCKGMDLAVTSSQVECLDKKFKIADSQLNDTYKQIMALLSDEKKSSLKREQVAWIKEKELKCASAGKEAAGGQMEAVLLIDCKVQTTESRLAYLKNYK